MKEHPGFCLNCFAPLARERDICGVCGTRMADHRARDYRDKLLHALHHPLSEVRMRAIIALGLRREAKTADALVECALRHPRDVVAGMEIARRLAQFKPVPTRRAALARLAGHPARAVRAMAQRALADAGGAGDADA